MMTDLLGPGVGKVPYHLYNPHPLKDLAETDSARVSHLERALERLSSLLLLKAIVIGDRIALHDSPHLQNVLHLLLGALLFLLQSYHLILLTPSKLGLWAQSSNLRRLLLRGLRKNAKVSSVENAETGPKTHQELDQMKRLIGALVGTYPVRHLTRKAVSLRFLAVIHTPQFTEARCPL